MAEEIILSLGDGHRKFDENFDGGATLVFQDAAVTKDNIAFQADGLSLTINYGNRGDAVTRYQWFHSEYYGVTPKYHTKSIRFANGRTESLWDLLTEKGVENPELLEKYKSIYFDAKYYLAEKAKAYNANGQGGRRNWTAADFAGIDAWADFRDNGAFYRHKNAAGETVAGINPSPYFDVNRYYQDWAAKGGRLTNLDPISDYARFVASQAFLVRDPAKVTMPVTPTRVGLGKREIDGLNAMSKVNHDHYPDPTFILRAYP